MWGKPKEVTKFKTIEVEKARKVDITPEMKDILASLVHNPGMQYELERLRLIRSYLQKQLAEGKHESLSDVAMLQAGVYWAGWLEAELTRFQPVKPPSQATLFEDEAFNAAKAALDVVGSQGQDS